MENTTSLITNRDEFVRELHNLIARTDLLACGAEIKPHEEKDEDGNKTGNQVGMFAKMNVRLPGVTGVVLDGETFYSKNANIAISAFKLANSVESHASAPKAKAATISASALRERLANFGSTPKASN